MAVTAVGYDNAVVKCKYGIIFGMFIRYNSITIAIIIIAVVIIIDVIIVIIIIITIMIIIVTVIIIAITTVAIVISYNKAVKQPIKLFACPF